MSRKERKTIYKRDILGRGGRQYILPWGPGKTITTQQAGDRLGVCYDTVRQMCESGELEGWQIRDIPHSPWRVSIESVDNYIARKMQRHDISGAPAAKSAASWPTSRSVTTSRPK